jgi:hypothetical protein
MRQEEEAAEVKAESQKKRRLMHVLDRCWEATNKGTVAIFSGELEYTAIEACLDGLIKPKPHGRRIKGYSITHKGRCAFAKWSREQGVMHDWEVSADYAKSAAEDGPASD